MRSPLTNGVLASHAGAFVGWRHYSATGTGKLKKR